MSNPKGLFVERPGEPRGPETRAVGVSNRIGDTLSILIDPATGDVVINVAEHAFAAHIHIDVEDLRTFSVELSNLVSDFEADVVRGEGNGHA